MPAVHAARSTPSATAPAEPSTLIDPRSPTISQMSSVPTFPSMVTPATSSPTQ
ncbi:MAG: hypothetical protein IPM13_08095 [Phycisphaerales bacterium]|nr:hypothetical protein [Phycisphaerales bacterium]